MNYLTCVSCNKIGISCDGANLLTLPAPELLEWCRLRKKYLNWSNAYLSERSGVPKGTIDRIFSSDPTDFRHETMRPIVTALIGGEVGLNPCPDPLDASAMHLREIIDIKSAEVDDLQKRLDEWKARSESSVAYYRRLYCILRKVTIAVVGLFLMVLIGLVTLFVFDIMHPEIGFFH